MRASKSVLLHATALLFWMGVIFYFSHQPNSNKTTLEIFGKFNFFARKLAHISEYAILSLLFFSLLKKLKFPAKDAELSQRNLLKLSESEQTPAGSNRIKFLRYPITIAFVFLFALLDEFHQSLIPGRTALFSDVLIDVLGCLIALTIAFAFELVQARKRPEL